MLIRFQFLVDDQLSWTSFSIITSPRTCRCVLSTFTYQPFMETHSNFGTRASVPKTFCILIGEQKTLYCKNQEFPPTMYIEVLRCLTLLQLSKPTFFVKQLIKQRTFSKTGCCYVTSEADFWFIILTKNHSFLQINVKKSNYWTKLGLKAHSSIPFFPKSF